MKEKKLFIILYGEQNQGKTTTLMELVVMLGGGSASLENAVKTNFFDGKRYDDARFIIEFGDKIIYVATEGDTWAACRQNTCFFERDFSNLTIHLVKNGSINKMTSLDKEEYKKKQLQVVVSACRPNADSNGAIKAIHSYSETYIMKYIGQRWIKRDKTEEPNSKTVAARLKSIIEEFVKINKL